MSSLEMQARTLDAKALIQENYALRARTYQDKQNYIATARKFRGQASRLRAQIPAETERLRLAELERIQSQADASYVTGAQRQQEMNANNAAAAEAERARIQMQAAFLNSQSTSAGPGPDPTYQNVTGPAGANTVAASTAINSAAPQVPLATVIEQQNGDGMPYIPEEAARGTLFTPPISASRGKLNWQQIAYKAQGPVILGMAVVGAVLVARKLMN